MKKNLILFLGALTLALLPQKAVADQNIPDGLSIDTDYNETEPGYYYINMPFKTTTTLDLSQYAGVINAFKVYDEQGKDAQYTSKNSGDAYLVVTAPDGYIFHVTGTVTTDIRGNDYLRFYDGTRDWANRYRYKYCFGTHSGEDVGLLYTSGKEMCLFFHAWSGNADGLDLTVTLINTAETHDITVQPAAVGGSATASPVSAGASTSVDGQLLVSLVVLKVFDFVLAQGLLLNGGEVAVQGFHIDAAVLLVVQDDGHVFLRVGNGDIGGVVLKVRLAIVVMAQVHLFVEKGVQQGAYGQPLFAKGFAFDERDLFHLVRGSGAQCYELLFRLGDLPHTDRGFIFKFLF